MNEPSKARKLPNIAKYFGEIRGELKKVVWPTPKQVVSNTFTVLMMCFLFGIVIWLADSLFNWLAQLIYGITLTT
jgi:preprotein translocase subunit SecE